jgi:hypothetical protein
MFDEIFAIHSENHIIGINILCGDVNEKEGDGLCVWRQMCFKVLSDL